MTQEEELAQLRAENQGLREALSQALARIAELEKQKTPPPEFVKANVKKKAAQEKKPRTKRDAKHNHGRRRAAPTQIVEHRLLTCPDCHLRLGGISLSRVREVIEVPLPPRWKSSTIASSKAGVSSVRNGTKLDWMFRVRC
jgi:transposase